MLCAGGGAEEASRTRVRSAWGKFNELAPVPDKKGCLFETEREKYMMPVYRECWYMVARLGL